MRNIYLLSGNPVHLSHINTWETAKTILEEDVYFCLCQNDLKDGGLFYLEERKKILINFYNVPENKILLLKNREDIFNEIKDSKSIIRGIRDIEDIFEIEKLAEYYNAEKYFTKLVKIKVPDHLKNISSSKLINLIKKNEYEKSMNWVPEQLFLLIKRKLKEKQME